MRDMPNRRKDPFSLADQGIGGMQTTRQQLLLKAGALGLATPGLMAFLAACGGDDNGETGAAGETGTEASVEGMRIGLSFPYREISYYNGFRRVTQEEADAAGVEPVYSQADPTVEAQLSELDSWISGNLVDALLIAPVDDAAVAPAVAQAVAANIPVVGWRSTLEGASGTLFFANVEGGYALGETAAQWINENLDGSAEVAMLTFPAQQTTVERIENATIGIEENVTGDVTFYEQEALLAADALPVVENLMQANPGIRVIICTADDACLGARPAYINSGQPRDNVFIAGWDGAPDVLEFIKEGDDLIRATAALPIEELARNAVRVPVQILGGAETPLEIDHQYVVVTEDTPDEEIDNLIAIHRG